jgi:predicted homoserine dehydrogenase-like protein
VNDIHSRLMEREKNHDPIRVALIGAGQMGTEIVTTVGQMTGMQVMVVADLTSERARGGFAHCREKPQLVETSSPSEAQAAIRAGRRIATAETRLATSLPEIEVVIDATGSTEAGAGIALDCIDHGKHLVMMNVECDVTIGPILRRLAENAGVVYTLAAGDEPAAIIELYRFARALGFEVVAAGKGKNNPLDIYATPAALSKNARARNMSANMLCEFVDGSKTAVEMAAVSNATGLVPDVRGMHGAKATVATLKEVFCPKSDGGVLNRSGVVEFAIGVHPGVFLVFGADNGRLQEALVQRDMGQGPYYLLYRPYHLCSIEVPLTVAQAVFYGESSGHPIGGLTSECLAVAKRDLKGGELLDGIGGNCYRGSIDLAQTARAERLLPLGLAKGCRLSRDIGVDMVLSYDDVQIEGDSVLLELRRLQDRRFPASP